MLTIAPAVESRRQSLAMAHGVPDAQVMLACNAGCEEGGCAYAITGKTVHLFHLWANDSMLQDGILRAVLNAAHLAGATMAVCGQEMPELLLRSAGFCVSKEGMTVDLAEFFSRPCRSAK